MSELVVGSIAGLAANSYVVDVAAGSSLDLTNSTGLPSSALPTIPADKLPTGSIVSVQTVNKTDTFSASVGGGGNTDVTGLSISHTLQSASNKLIITGMFGSASHSLFVNQVAIGVKNDGTLIGLGDAGSGQTRITAGGRTAGSADSASSAGYMFQFVYEPGDTSAHTYQLCAFNLRTDTRTVYVNRTPADGTNAEHVRALSSLTIMEVTG